MSTIVYTLKQNPTSLEYHLFEATPNNDDTCSAKPKSMCQMMKRVSGAKFACKTEKEAFIECAKLGRQVCGNCMKELYSTED